MPASIIEEADRLPGAAEISAGLPTCHDDLPPAHAPFLLACPSCGSPHVAQMLGDNGGVSYVCTACGHIWS
ncbi:hypothetical protein [Streptomyces beihaiensis]|uniref:Uncharacterized protein n=1 Tax=Streptomyces beihaiensis TaxID=2984495 RepID=A0ABT3U4X8_9ACTN|nr:hypothetical protein [Streptomyces beihaiensis]MCX3064349.1 hypothetical protein [Streptomyces beihaiensis]